MWANTCWGFFGIAIALGLAVVGLTPEHLWLQPWLIGGAMLSGACSVLCFLWPLWKRIGISKGSANLVGAIYAFNTIVSKSRWAKRLRKRPDEIKFGGMYEGYHTSEENIKARLESQLDREIHDKLRAGQLTAWERTSHNNPLRPIPNDEWDEIEIMFDKESLNKFSKNACAWLRNRRIPGNRIRYIEVQFPQT